MKKTVKVLVSNRHVHLNAGALETLFGSGYALTVKRALETPIFVANETVTLRGPKGEIRNVTVLGPLRAYVQAEILRADNFVLGINAPVRISGSSELAKITMIGPAGTLDADAAVVAKRHIHMTPVQAAACGLHKGQIVSVAVGGERKLVFGETMIVFTEILEPTMHIDIEEANAAAIEPGMIAEIILP